MKSLTQLIIKCIDFVYIKPIRGLISRNMFAYGVCGATNMALDTLWYFLIYHFVIAQRFINLGFVVVSPHIASLVLVFPITFFTGFWLNRNIAFCATEFSSRRQLARYALSVIGSIIINYISMKILVEHLYIWPTPSKMLTTIISVIYSYLVGKYFTFNTVNV